MKHKIKMQVPVEKRGLFGGKKTVIETRTVEVDGKTYRKLKQEREKQIMDPIEALLLLDELDD